MNDKATGVLEALEQDRVLSIVRAPRIDDVVALADALSAGGIRVLELTFTTPGLTELLQGAAEAASRTGSFVGAGTVTTGDHAKAALEAGAQFIVTPGLGPHAREIVDAAHRAGAAAVLGALTPSEVMTAVELGADVVKIFPARAVGPAYLSDLHGPFPDVALIPSGGVNASNAADFLANGALAVTAGTSVVAPADVENARWSEVTRNAAAFCAALR
ncbi:MAG TPA: bifunctional 4-hydroxy-2-oxoglutarate aldolase/2-dehydro-3-deoxy-phosphogluconate aldolase [Flexivirga sp.]|uniref:bifunctional 4-hydroxy-2-oxoglutarate aldolase/2-dehydro-3-deoxy-phosphogluconate aldolase n=1 Tax=Flexivirga sp. TaxID=1962927 RepID=UPI002BC8A908|nr:bifunctional 4-hydroxy-2-oxoglutarate aldolase/2-dehydro-3-deoxy-phosphogluconate aldolase [Flexivirga sp.]HWC22593.1 bifunctional 4-hydroxy-2-oxoglutarate aldolase/2-dehydro-3-deoxy-phosphogluconate aldolase [Flexivirga sp.]